jgi:hypothetical protein
MQQDIYLPEGMLLKNCMVARVMLVNIALWRLTDALMHIVKNDNTLLNASTMIAIMKPVYTRIHVSVLGSHSNSVQFVAVMTVEFTQLNGPGTSFPAANVTFIVLLAGT